MYSPDGGDYSCGWKGGNIYEARSVLFDLFCDVSFRMTMVWSGPLVMGVRLIDQSE